MFFGLVVVVAAILYIHVQKHFCYKIDRSDGIVDRFHWYDYDDGGSGGDGGVVDGAGGPFWKGTSRATARRVPIAAWIYSLRMSSTKAVSRSSPISLYFSFSMTSSSVCGIKVDWGGRIRKGGENWKRVNKIKIQ